MPTPKQISMARAIIAKTGNTDRKDYLILCFTCQRSMHISDMTDDEFKHLITHLKTLQRTPLGDGGKFTAAEKMRRKMIYYAHEMGWWLPDTKGNKKRVNMKQLDDWCLQFGYIKKKLDNYTAEELPDLISQFERVHASYLKNVSR